MANNHPQSSPLMPQQQQAPQQQHQSQQQSQQQQPLPQSVVRPQQPQPQQNMAQQSYQPQPQLQQQHLQRPINVQSPSPINQQPLSQPPQNTQQPQQQYTQPQQQQQQQPPKPYMQGQYSVQQPQQQQHVFPQQSLGGQRPLTTSQNANAQAYYNQPPAKRQRVSPDPRSQPTSPYTGSPYSASPTTTSAPQHALSPALPHFPNSIPQQTYQGPYSQPAQNLSHPSPYTSAPQQQPIYQSLPPNNIASQQPLQPNYQGANQQPYNSNYPAPQPQSGAMMPPPPVKPPVRDENANDDQMDILANAGVNLREEEQFAMSFHTNSIRQQPAFGASGPNALGSAYTQFSTQDADSFYGSGPANQPASQIKDGKTQEEIEKEMADDAWKHAANRLAIARQQELGNPRTHVGALWSRMDKIAKDNGLTLNTDNGKMPKLKLPDEFPSQTVQIKTKVGPNGNMVVADGVFLPQDTALADQLALVSLATSFRIRGLLEEAYALSQARRLHSQGVVPPKYHDIAVPMSPDDGTIVQDIAPRHGWESAISLGTKPNGLPPAQKKPARQPPALNSEGALQMTNETIRGLRESAAREREWEESRLAKRAARLANGGVNPSSGGTPAAAGSVAPEPSGKPLTKKEREKADKKGQSLVDSHAQANATTAAFLFGGKKGKKYSWMDGGASGASTPNVGGGGAVGQPQKVRLTVDGKNRMGGWKEDRDGGKGIQVRDLVQVLEADGNEGRALQRLYAWLDGPKPKAAVQGQGGL